MVMACRPSRVGQRAQSLGYERIHCSKRQQCTTYAGKCWLVGSGPGSLELMTVQRLLV